jgi:hypothetical protein
LVRYFTCSVVKYGADQGIVCVFHSWGSQEEAVCNVPELRGGELACGKKAILEMSEKVDDGTADTRDIVTYLV